MVVQITKPRGENMNEAPDHIERTVKELKTLMERNRKYALKTIRYAKRTLETQTELYKLLKHEALGEP